MIKSLSPICLFVYNRISEVRNTIQALQKNYQASETNLFIFSDEAKNEVDHDNVREVRKFIHSISGFKSVQIIESDHHKGLSVSILNGVTEIINRYNKVIVLEDDLVTSPNFLDFMNQGLDFYSEVPEIFSINGYSMDLKSLNGYSKEYYLTYRSSSWGWATWKDRWEIIDWEVKDFKSLLLNPIKHFKFMKVGSDMPYMLWKQRIGLIDSWAIRWCYHQFKNNLLSVVSSESKIVNIGIGDQATHTKKTKRFRTKLDNGTARYFVFDNILQIDPNLIQEFKQQHSFIERIKDHF